METPLCFIAGSTVIKIESTTAPAAYRKTSGVYEILSGLLCTNSKKEQHKHRNLQNHKRHIDLLLIYQKVF